MKLLDRINETKALHLGVVIGRFLLKLPWNFYLLRPHKSDKTFLWYRSKIYLDEYFGEEAIKSNGEQAMETRMMGFEDGYLACLKDLGVKLTYMKPNDL
jgi:hypothetical protein